MSIMETPQLSDGDKTGLGMPAAFIGGAEGLENALPAVPEIAEPETVASKTDSETDLRTAIAAVNGGMTVMRFTSGSHPFDTERNRSFHAGREKRISDYRQRLG